MRAAHGGLELREHRAPRPSTLGRVARDAARQPHLVRHVEEEREIEQRTCLGLVQQQNAFHEHDGTRLDQAVVADTPVRHEAIARRPHRSEGAQRAQVLDEEGRIERVRHVVVERGALGGRQLAAVAVIRVVAEHRHAVRSQRAGQGAAQRRLAGAATSGHADDERRAHAATSTARDGTSPA